MSGIVIAALALGKVASTKHSLDIALAFITAQALLAYGTSGFLKLTKAGWLNGTYVLEILKTSTFGNRKILDYFSKRIMLRFAASFIVVFGDILLSISVLFPPKICLCILLIGLCLHLGIAFVMGLNTFVWAFCATYPAIFYFSCKLYHQVYL
ncbi:hypothetical protein [Mucilaginibacter polytrichastri]|nr:hypothetical protein [Mucilaginibacter polytrichastri]